MTQSIRKCFILTVKKWLQDDVLREVKHLLFVVAFGISSFLIAKLTYVFPGIPHPVLVVIESALTWTSVILLLIELLTIILKAVRRLIFFFIRLGFDIHAYFLKRKKQELPQISNTMYVAYHNNDVKS
jgi:hypothetical protein